MIKTEVEGSFSVKVLRDGKEINSLPRQKNLILADAMSRIDDFGNYLHVGTGNTPPSYNDTNLVNHLAVSQSSSWGNLSSALNGSVYEKESVNTYTFTTGSVVGNIAELGVSRFSTASGIFHTRALFKDGAGDPTTITVTSADQLVITYYVKKYISMAPTQLQVTSGGNVIDYTFRPFISSNGDGGADAFYPASMYQEISSNNLYLYANNTNTLSIDPVTYIPTTIDTGYEESPEGSNSILITANGNEVTHTITFPINDANFQFKSLVGTISPTSIAFAFFQIEFDGPNYITKNNTETVTIKIKEVNNQVV